MAYSKRTLEPWLELFDASEARHVRDLITDAIGEIASGGSSALHGPLHRHLMASLDAYIQAHQRAHTSQPHVQSARCLFELASDLAAKFKAGHRFAQQDAQPIADELHLAWLEVIADGAGYQMYSERPKGFFAKTAAAALPRGHAKGLTFFEVAQRVKAAGGKLSEDLAESIAEEYKVGVRTVRRRLATAREAGLLP